MNNMKAKLKKQGGFTLIEMLIVVAIIAILIAVSIPIIGVALEKARDATDQANMRSAAALGNVRLLTNDSPPASGTETKFYSISTTGGSQGSLVDSGGTKGECRGASGCVFTDKPHTEKVIQVVINYTDGTVTVTWENAS